jgi:lysophospholipase L1-like esterase
MPAHLFRSAIQWFKVSPGLLRVKLLPVWVLISLTTNAILLIMLAVSLLRSTASSGVSVANLTAPQHSSNDSMTPIRLTAVMPEALAEPAPKGERHQLNYGEWLTQLQREAQIAAERSPQHLTVLAGDSISLWFPSELLPSERYWLNQGISGETSAGLLKRLDLFQQTQPTTIFVMIGINDLLRGTADQSLLANQEQIIQSLRQTHPKSQIVVQSILPRAAESDWEGRDRLLAIPNPRIQQLNRQLETLARQSGVYFLDLYPLFATPEGDLRPEFTTDGLHLSYQGYQTWRIALQVYSREVLGLDPLDQQR